MKNKFFGIALGLALSATATSAGAQKTYAEGIITYKTSMRGQDVEVKEYFTTDSAAAVFTTGSATIKLLSDANHKSFAILIDVPVSIATKW